MKLIQWIEQTILLLIFFSISAMINAQTLPLNDPTTYVEWRNDNRLIAEAFAPVLVQFYNDSNNSNHGRYDIPLRVNYDEDWYHPNNWGNGSSIDNRTLDPEAYFHVFWTDDYWVAVYSFYYPRDYAQGLFCGFAEHEGDTERVYVYIERPEDGNYAVEDLLRGYAVTNHGKKDHVNCLTPEQMVVSTNSSSTITNGAHPISYASAGSHAMYACGPRAWLDSETSFPNNQCLPTVEGNYVLNPVSLSSSTGTGDVADATGYKLIDLHDPAIGLWDRRSSTSVFLFSSIADRHKQKFNGDDPAKASAPWNGTGFDPIDIIGEYIDDYNHDCTKGSGVKFGDPFRCSCKTPIGDCTDVSFEEQDYTFNGLRCEGYNFLPLTEQTDRSISANIIHHNLFNPDNDELTWTISSAGIDYTCIGCDQGKTMITLVPQEDGFCGSNFQVTVSAEITSIECGTTSFTQTYVGTLTPEELGENALASTSLLQNRIYNFGDSGLPADPQQITRTFNRIKHNITASNGGEIWINRKDKIAFTDEVNNPMNTTQSSFTAYVGGCGFNSTLTIGDQGKLWVGENDNASNNGYLYVEDGSSIIIEDGGLVEVDRPSRLVIESGAVLRVKNGAELRTNRTGQIIIEEGAKLIIDDGAEIGLWWSDANIHIKGELEINGQFKFPGSGYFQFDDTHTLSLNSDFHLTGNGSRFIQLNEGAILKIGSRDLNLEDGVIKYGDGASIEIGSNANVSARWVTFSGINQGSGSVAINADGPSKLDFFSCNFENLFVGIYAANGQLNQIYRNLFCNYDNCSVGVWTTDHPKFEFQATNFQGGNQSASAVKAENADFIGFSGGLIQDYNVPGINSSAIELTNVIKANLSGVDLINNHIGVQIDDVPEFRLWGVEIRNSEAFGIYAPQDHFGNNANQSNVFLHSGSILEENTIGIQVDKGGQLIDGSFYGKVSMNCSKLIHNDIGIQGQDVLLEIDAFDHCDCESIIYANPNTFIKNSIPQDYELFFNICYVELPISSSQISARANYWQGGLNPGSDYILKNSTSDKECKGSNFISLITNPMPLFEPNHCNNSGPEKPKEEHTRRNSQKNQDIQTEDVVHLFPNPANDLVTVKLAVEKSELMIYNTLGEEVYRSRLTDPVRQIDISEWPKGIYLIKVKTINPEKEWIKKLVVQ